jgi:hypothetical protein
MRNSKTPIFSFILIILSLAFFKCGDDESSDDDDSSGETTNTGVVAAGSSSGSSSDSDISLTDEVDPQLAAAETSVAPGSLAVGETALHLIGDDPCENSENFYDCQPNLLKLYLDLSKNGIKTTREIVKGLDQLLRIVGAGKGSFDLEEDDGIEKIYYDITSATKFDVLAVSEIGPVIRVQKEDENIWVNFHGKNEIKDGEATADNSKMAIHFKGSIEKFTVDFRMHRGDCDPNDVGAPAGIRILLDYEDGVRVGQSQMYLPRWINLIDGGITPSCNTIVTPINTGFMFTEFAADDTYATAGVYLGLGSEISSNDDIHDHPLSNIYKYIPGCSNTTPCGDIDFDDFTNNFCADKSSMTHAWGENCTSSDNDKISEATFLSDDRWLTPAELTVFIKDLPEEL